MTKRPRFKRPSLISATTGRLDVFWRSRKNTLIHTWFVGEDLEKQVDIEELSPEIKLLSDPIVVSRGEHKIDVYARATNQQLYHWWCYEPGGAMQGPRELWWKMIYDPIVVAGAGRAEVFVRRSDDRLRWFAQQGDEVTTTPFPTSNEVWTTEPEDTLGPVIVCTSQPAAIFNADNDSIEVLFRNGVGQIEWFTWKPTAHGERMNRHLNERRPNGSIDLGASPQAASYQPGRLDVFVKKANGTLVHWGHGGYFSVQWIGPEASIAQRLENVPTIIPSGINSTDIFARFDDRTLKNWTRTPGWSDPIVLGSEVYSDAGAVSISENHVEAAAVDAKGNLLRWVRKSGPWRQREPASLNPIQKIPLSEEDQRDLLAGKLTKLLILRPDNHAIMGLDWSECDVVAGSPPRLLARDNAVLTIVFPPQHIAEQAQVSFGATLWRSFLSGPSRLSLAVPRGQQIDLTSDGVLNAINGLNVDVGNSFIELPWGLALTPKAGESGLVARYAPPPNAQLSGLSKLSLLAKDPGRPLAISARNVRDDPGDPFIMPLSNAARSSVAANSLQSPAAVERLELSALGGSLIAHGNWDNLEWDHNCALGRDQTVRVLSRGVLYPLGHKAVFVEMTERQLDPKASAPVAALRKHITLIVTEPIRAASSDPAVSHLFPFSETEILTRYVGNLLDPSQNSVQHPRVFRQIEELEREIRECTDRLPEIKEQIPGTGVPEIERDVKAQEYLDLLSKIEQLNNTINDLQQSDLADKVPIYVWPSYEDQSGQSVVVQFDVRLQGDHGPIYVRMPLLFVWEWKLPRDDVYEAFDSLANTVIADALQQEYGEAGAGVVDVQGAVIGLIQPSTSPHDYFETARLNITGFLHGGAVIPRLSRHWGAEIKMPATRALLADAKDTFKRVRYSEGYGRNAAVDVALELVEGFDLDFTKRANRSGGLLAPIMPIDAISRSSGLACKGSGNAVSTNPMQFFKAGASLLGFDLRRVIDPNVRVEPPKILTELTPGELPTVSMIWENVPLVTLSEGPHNGASILCGTGFEPHDAKVTLSVVTSGSDQRIHADLGRFSLHFPCRSPFITLSFDSLCFTQTNGRSPELKLGSVEPKFGNELQILDKLARNVNIGNTGPNLEVRPDHASVGYRVGVPDLTLVSFNLSNLEFHAQFKLPFKGEAPSASIGFGTRNRPFTLGVMMFAGAGHIEIGLDQNGSKTFDVSLQFGALLAINFLIGRAEVHAFGGIGCQTQSGSPVFLAFIHMGGSIQLLGISVAFELSIQLKAAPEGNKLAGRAKVALEVGLLGLSHTFELDSGEWVICGDEPTRHVLTSDDRSGLEAWARYRGAFA